MHGAGHLVLSNGNTYEGSFRHGKFHGTGTYTFAKTNSSYSGVLLTPSQSPPYIVGVEQVDFAMESIPVRERRTTLTAVATVVLSKTA